MRILNQNKRLPGGSIRVFNQNKGCQYGLSPVEKVFDLQTSDLKLGLK